jgi:hypothetical protein
MTEERQNDERDTRPNEPNRFVTLSAIDLESYQALSDDQIRDALQRGEQDRRAAVAASQPTPSGTRTRYR